MRDYVIVTDSASDLPKEILKEYDIPCLPLYYSIDGVIYGDEKNIEPSDLKGKNNEKKTYIDSKCCSHGNILS